MQHTASLVQIAASRRSPALVAGVDAAFVASAITRSVVMSGAAPATAPQHAAAEFEKLPALLATGRAI